MSAEPITETPVTPAIDFLQRWEPAGPWVLTAIDPETKRIQTRSFSPKAAGTAAAWIVERNRKRHWNIYFLVNRPKRALTKKAKKTDIAEIVSLHVDIDLPGGRDEEEERSRLAPHESFIVFGWIEVSISQLGIRHHPGGQCEADQLRETAGPHLVHEARAVDLNGARADREIVSNRFVGQPREQPLQHFPLPWRE